MNKLTKEQSQWLIETLKVKYWECDKDEDPNDLCFNSISRIINQCTENILDVEEKSIETHAKAFKEAIESFPI